MYKIFSKRQLSSGLFRPYLLRGMMTDRRSFMKISAIGSLAAGSFALSGYVPSRKGPVVISTWNHGIAANEAAWGILNSGGSALDAVEAGVRVTEADPTGRTVGIGGLPDREGNVTLDACIMNEHGDAGSVAYLQHIMHPISVARKVMEETPHVMLVGEGALAFALSQGFEKTNLLTPEAEAEWKKWKAENDPDTRPEINVENHDTIGQLALDMHGNLSGACTTSGASWKMPGRVGDSPIIGAGLFVDNEVGAACATGWGEAVIRVVGSHLVVELMRQGHDPMTACRKAVDRVISKNPDYRDIQVGFVALDRQGRFGAYAIQPGFEAAVYDAEGNRLLPASSHL